MLHIKGAGGFTTLIVPRRKGTKAPTVKREGEAFEVAMNDKTLQLSADGYTFTGADRVIVTAFSVAGLPDGK